MEHDKNSKGNMRNGVIEKVSNVLDYDYYDDYDGDMRGGSVAAGETRRPGIPHGRRCYTEPARWLGRALLARAALGYYTSPTRPAGRTAAPRPP